MVINLPSALAWETISFPDDGDRWKLWDQIHSINVCRSWVDGLECIAAPGSYAIVNVTTGNRTSIEIEAGEPTVDGNLIRFPDDGSQWKLWDRINLANICLSWVDGLECVAELGSYDIVNVSTGRRQFIEILDPRYDTGDTGQGSELSELGCAPGTVPVAASAGYKCVPFQHLSCPPDWAAAVTARAIGFKDIGFDQLWDGLTIYRQDTPYSITAPIIDSPGNCLAYAFPFEATFPGFQGGYVSFLTIRVGGGNVSMDLGLSSPPYDVPNSFSRSDDYFFSNPSFLSPDPEIAEYQLRSCALMIGCENF